MSREEVLEKAESYFKKYLSAVTKIPTNRIEPRDPFEKYGIDSIMVIQMTNNLEKDFGPLSKTLFFEYKNINELAGYFIENHYDALLRIMGMAEKAPLAALGNIKDERISINTRKYSPRRRIKHETAAKKEDLDIAIIGLAGRYPKAKNLKEFWDNLRQGVDCITEVPKERWDHSRYFDEDKNKPGKTYAKWGGFLDDVDKFDPLFFNIPPVQAAYMDPQERLFLECVYETLEDAGYRREAQEGDNGGGIGGEVGVYVGVMYEEYQLYGAQLTAKGRPVAIPGNPSSIANMASYFFNFHGPSVALDTMCSSSLTAMHMACSGIRNGECGLAIAGGVNVSIHPNKYLMLAQGKFVSSKGRCESFGEGGDGYVPGEGVGAVLLKPLPKAIEDRDHIYGIIKATELNHGGKTNGYTVPNPKAQSEVIGKAFKKAGINPRTISYIEAHGTGTSLGDPIEISGLTRAFAEYTQDRQFCAIGSVKSNIGHCESAAGISGVTKVLLQMKNRKLVPSLHSGVLNPNIDFSKTPFTVQHELTEWKRPVIEIDGKTEEYPRIAGISSFGAGGANAHVIIEEYEAKEDNKDKKGINNPSIIVLSAKSKEQAREQAVNLLRDIEENEYTDMDLENISYTLQVGREAMEERLGLIVSSTEELKRKLKEYIDGKQDIEDLYEGQAKRNKEALSVFTADEELQKAVDSWIGKGKYGKLLDLWVKGLEFDWDRLYGGEKPKRVSLPTYPFARERYWIPESEMKFIESDFQDDRPNLHPLLHENTSIISEQRYAAIIKGNESYLLKNAIKDQKIIPGFICLEMAYDAIKEAFEIIQEEYETRICIKNIIWNKPCILNKQPKQIHIRLVPENNGEVNYEIYGKKEDSGNEETFNSGNIGFLSNNNLPVMNIGALRDDCRQKTISGEDFYKIFKDKGIEYNEKNKGIAEIFTGKDKVFAKLVLHSSSSNSDKFTLQPVLLEAALQASAALSIESEKKDINFPVSMKKFNVFGRCGEEMWAYIRYGTGNIKAGEIRDMDIDIIDESGKICISMIGIKTGIVKDLISSSETSFPLDKFIIKPYWTEEEVTNQSTSTEYKNHKIYFCEPDNLFIKDIPYLLKDEYIIFHSESDDISKRFEDYAIRLFEDIKKFFEGNPKDKFLIQVVVFDRGEKILFSALAGLLKTAVQENQKLVAQLIEIGPEEDTKEAFQKIKDTVVSPDEFHIRYQDNKRYLLGLRKEDLSQTGAGIPWKDGGVYLITGGAGGLGFIFAKEIAQKVKKAVVVLTGRSELTEEKQNQLNGLKKFDAEIIYKQVDVVDAEEINDLIKSIGNDFGNLTGIIHSAGVLHDNFIVKKNGEEVHKVMAPKVAGLVNIDLAAKDQPLDFFIVFSSIASVFGNPGQADYAAANNFMDVYAKYRNEKVLAKERSGQTISINWPLWKEGGMGVDEWTEKRITERSGMVSMRSETGIQALNRGLALKADQIIVLEGDPSRLNRFLKLLKVRESNDQLLLNEDSSIKKQVKTSGKGRRPEMKGLSLEECIIWNIKEIISKLFQYPKEKIDLDINFKDFGFDSISLGRFADNISSLYDIDFTPALFFTYPTIEELTKYFLAEHKTLIQEYYGKDIIIKDAPAIEDTSVKKTAFNISRMMRGGIVQSQNEPIAIIGMSGRFPQAGNVDELWNILEEGKEAVREIPPERFDWRKFTESPDWAFGKDIWKCGYLSRVDEFDPLFFQISPREAEIMDPRQRLLLQESWKALEDAGYGPAQINKYKIGMFVGVEPGDYQYITGGNTSVTSNHEGILAARLAYFLDLHGPNMAINTACSSGLVAAHQACMSLRNGECDTAIAAGVNILLTPTIYLGMIQSGMLSPDGRCYAFDKRANGMVVGEAVAAVVLKTLSKAEADGDPIYAVIKGSGINYDGKTNGITAPNGLSQTNLLKMVYDRYKINPEEIGCVFTHGTGTALGDPVEINALNDAYKAYTSKEQYCAIVSIKTHLGHTFAASGIVNLISLILAFRHRTIPASLNIESENDYINWKNSPFFVNKSRKLWLAGEGGSLTGAVSAFGMSGTNAHMVLESYERKGDAFFEKAPYYILTLSAKTEDALKLKISDMVKFLNNRDVSEYSLPRVSRTLLTGRHHFEYRCAIVVNEIEDALYLLRQIDGEDKPPNVFRGKTPRGFKGQKAIKKYIQDLLDEGKSLHSKPDQYMDNLYALADFYCQGYSIAWDSLFGETGPARCALPTYPFAQEHYLGVRQRGTKLYTGDRE